MSAASVLTREPDPSVALPGEQRLSVEEGPESTRLRIWSREGRVSLTVEVTESGPVLHFERSVEMAVPERMRLVADRLELHGREHVAIESGGDARMSAQGDLWSEARIQNLRARLGNVNVKANDDVRMRGERIRLNC